ncbi:hypothetical protein M9H77_03731 [Catharanthus roseus]|uniref:Uncharacterized protein n=1 Tax=Catharanthus roseus TaxID=4058 RepID=A0ACC0CCH2_CATRO|nr:hypothetical protein M9H77_03731 [Catharanthus roseus]
MKGFQLCCGSTIFRIKGSSSLYNHIPRGILEELKGSIVQCVKGVCTDSTRETLDGIALKAEHLPSNDTPHSEEEVMMLTRDFGKFLPKIEKNIKTPREAHNL